MGDFSGPRNLRWSVRRNALAPALMMLVSALYVCTVQAEIGGSQAELRQLKALSSDLVERARSGEADATRFRIDTTIYRESLRRLMLRLPRLGVAIGNRRE